MVEATIFLSLSGLIATSGKHCIVPEGMPLRAYVDESNFPFCRIRLASFAKSTKSSRGFYWSTSSRRG